MLDVCSKCGLVSGKPSAIPPSPFEHILHTNHALCRSELKHAREIVLEVEDDLARLEDQIAQLQQKRDALMKYAKDHRALLTPIRRVPPEILSDIFLACLPPVRLIQQPQPESSVFDVKSPPWVFGHVCGQWRAVALSSPRLWSSVSVDANKDRTNMTSALDMVETGCSVGVNAL